MISGVATIAVIIYAEFFRKVKTAIMPVEVLPFIDGFTFVAVTKSKKYWPVQLIKNKSGLHVFLLRPGMPERVDFFNKEEFIGWLPMPEV